MITPQDIREKTFEKAVFGGYDMSAVDDFLEEAAGDLALLQKENATLRGKMKVLVSKIEEYRANEETLQQAILSAQRLGSMIEQEAREKSDKIVAEAKSDAARITREASIEAEAQSSRLEEAKRSSAQFIENMNLLCQRQMDFLSRLGDTSFVQDVRSFSQSESAPRPGAVDTHPTPVERRSAPQVPIQAVRGDADSEEIHETVKSIEETVAKVADELPGQVHPDIQAAAQAGGDEQPTRSYDIVSAAASSDAIEDSRSELFSFDPIGR